MDRATAPNRINRRAMLALLVAPACARGPQDPVEVATTFLDYYLVQVDQQRALSLSVGLAKDKLEGEIRDVAAVRAAGASVERTDAPAFDLTGEREADRGGTIYLFDITMPGEEIASRRILVTIATEGESWAVTNYGFYPIR